MTSDTMTFQFQDTKKYHMLSKMKLCSKNDLVSLWVRTRHLNSVELFFYLNSIPFRLQNKNAQQVSLNSVFDLHRSYKLIQTAVIDYFIK